MPNYKSKYELKVECVITVPFHAEDPVKLIDEKQKEYWAARKKDEQAARDIVKYIRGTLRDELSCIPFENDELCSQQTRIRVKRIDDESV